MNTTPMYMVAKDKAGVMQKIKIADITTFGHVFHKGKYLGQVLPGPAIDKHIDIGVNRFDILFHFPEFALHKTLN